MEIIEITDIGNIKIGNAQNFESGTGVTVLIFPDGAPAGVDIRGGGPASRETPLLDPVAAADIIHAVVLSGGSAFGLDAAGGVMEYLENKGIGFSLGDITVPLVCQSCIFDLTVGDSKIRPDKKMAIEACENSEKNIVPHGCIGGGTGASVGKLYNMDRAMKSGIGVSAVSIGNLKVGAIVIVNALGDIFDSYGDQIAGLLDEKCEKNVLTEVEMYKLLEDINSSNTNTTIGAIITNADFDKSTLKKIASMAHNGYARAINPVHTMLDGDSIYAVSLGKEKADINVVGTIAARVMAEAIEDAIKSSKAMYGLKAYSDIKGEK